MRVKIFARSLRPTRLMALLMLVLIVGLVISQPAQMQRAASQSDGHRAVIENQGVEEYLPGQVIVQLNPGFDIDTVAPMFGLDPNPIASLDLPDDEAGTVTSYLLRILDSSTVEDKVAQLSADTLRVLFAEPHYIHEAPEASRPTWSVGDSYGVVAAGRKTYNGQWARRNVRLDEAHQVTRGMSTGPNPTPVVVAVLDTGIDMNHPLFAGRLVPGHDFVDGDDDPSEEGNPQAGPFGHGTHVAGVIAMVAPDAKIMPLRVLGVDGRGTAFTLAAAVKYAVDNGADVVNMSISTPKEMKVVGDTFYHVLEGPEVAPAGSMPGAVAVVAAGNSGTTAKQYPAGVADTGRPGREVLAVAAGDSTNLLTIFSTRGSWVSVMAPGFRITSTVPYNRYANWSGTSMAAPLVAGEVALLRAINSSAEPDDVVDHVEQYALPSGLGQPPRIDIMRALSFAIND